VDDEHIALQLAHLGRGVEARLRKVMSAAGMTPRHGFALQHLCDHGPTSQQDLIEVLEVDPSVLVAILNDLEKAGFAERKRDPADRRRHIVVMSDPGMRALGGVTSAVKTMERELLADLSPSDVAELGKLLAKLRPINGTEPCVGDD
jgi:DNA-binding MarR family transcriptional regulator